MLSNLEKQRILDELEHLKNPKAFREKTKQNSKIWKPVEGKENVIRILQYPYGENEFIDLHYHFGVAGKHVMCLYRNFNKDCPICKLASKLFNSSNPDDKQLGKQLFAKQRWYAVVIDRSEQQPTPKFWSFGKSMYQKLLEYRLNDEYANYLDPINGIDAIVTLNKIDGKRYCESTLTFRRKESRLADTDEQIKSIKNAIPKIEDVFTPMTEAQIRKLLDDWTNNETDDGLVKGGDDKEKQDLSSGMGEENFNQSDFEAHFTKAIGL